MVCNRCGAEIKPGTSFCMNCGAPVTEAPQQNAAPAPAQVSYPSYNPAPAAPVAPVQEIKPTTVLVWGIVALACSLTFYFSFLGIIFGAIGKKKAKAYVDAYGPISGQVKTGGILAKIGFIAGIVMTVFLVIFIIAMIASY